MSASTTDSAATDTADSLSPPSLIAFNVPTIRSTIYSHLGLGDLATCARLRRHDNWEDVVKLLYRCHNDPLIYWKLKKNGASKERLDGYIKAIKTFDFAVAKLQGEGKNWSARLEKGKGVMTTYPNLELVRVINTENQKQSALRYWGSSFHIRRIEKDCPDYVVETVLVEFPLPCICLPDEQGDEPFVMDVLGLKVVADLIQTGTACHWLDQLPSSSKLWLAPVRTKGHLRHENVVPECVMDHWKYTATAGDHIDTLILGDQPKWEDEEPPCKPFKMLGIWDGLTTLTIPLSMTNGALDMLADDQCPSLIRLEVDCVAPLHDSHIEGSEPDLRAPGSAAIGLLEALRRLSGHVPHLEQLHWPVEDEETVSKLIRRADNAGATSITPSTSPVPFPRLHTLTVGPFIWPSLPAPAARQYPALLQPYMDQAAVAIESATWRKDEYEEFQGCLYRRVARAMQTGVLTPPSIDGNKDSLMAQQEWQLQLLKRLSTVVGGRGELEELTNRRVDDWLKWYEWYHSFSAWRESARKVAGHDVGTAARTPGWKVLVG